MENQKFEVLSFVESERLKGRTLSEVLKNLKIARSSYYRWVKAVVVTELFESKSQSTVRTLTAPEKVRVDRLKDLHPEMRHRQIQGMLQIKGTYLSATSVYKHLKEQGKVEHYERRAAPWKEPRYEVMGANVMWGTDWTKLRIGGMRWYLLTLIDFFFKAYCTLGNNTYGEC